MATSSPSRNASETLEDNRDEDKAMVNRLDGSRNEVEGVRVAKIEHTGASLEIEQTETCHLIS